MPKIATARNNRLPSATAAMASADTCPTTIVSTTPMLIQPIWMATTGIAKPHHGAELGAEAVGGGDGVGHAAN